MNSLHSLEVTTALQDVTTAYARIAHAAAQAHKAERQYLDTVHAASTAHHDVIAQFTQAALGGTFRWSTAPWSDPLWSAFAPELAAPIPATVRLGHVVPLDAPTLELPALAPLIGHGHLFFLGQDPAATRQLLQVALLRLLVSFPPGRLRLILVDPVTTGRTLAAFFQLPPLLRGSEVIINPEALEQQLCELEDQITDLSQTRRSNPAPTLKAYYASSDPLPSPYRILALADLPAGLDERSTARLMTIARNGPRVGIYIVASLNPTVKTPRNFALNELTNLGTVVQLTASDRLTWDDPVLAKQTLTADSLPPVELMQHWLALVGTAAVEVTEHLLPFRRLAIPVAERWQGDATDRLSVPVGVSGTGRPYLLALGDNGAEHHGLLGGTVGTGKSNLLHVLILQLALRYAPEELELYLLDFRGDGFQAYTALPHARVVALESERELALSVLLRLQEEVRRRRQLYRQAPGGAVEKLAEYRRQTGQRLARILLIMDEFQVLFSEEDRLSTEAARSLEDLVKRGHNFGIHVLLCSQASLIASVYGGQIANQMGLRLALRCSVQDSQAILGNDAASRLERSGEVLAHNEVGTFRVAHLPMEVRRDYLVPIAALTARRTGPPAVLFEAHTPANLLDNPALQASLQQATWPSQEVPAHLWLGEPVAMKGPTAARFERYPGSNLLIAGGSDAEGYGMLTAALLSLAAQRGPTAARFVIIDLARPDMLGAVALRRVSEALPHSITLLGERQSTEALTQLTGELAQRQGASGISGPDCYLVVAGLQRWRALRSDDVFQPVEARKHLIKLADEGPEVGMHLMLWVDGIANLERALGRSALASFDWRVALRLAESESTMLVGIPAAARMADNRALLRDKADGVGIVEKFKPYPLPEVQGLEDLLTLLRSR
ncbi:MAG: FtsK/SpoIIIE domain-containing protein [Chloroflexales bacterium]